MAFGTPAAAGAQTSVLPSVNRSSLVFFAGAALVVLNFYWSNGGALTGAIFHKGGGAPQLTGIADVALQIIGLAILTLMAEYGGDGAGSFALVFLAALWLLWLVVHFRTKPASGGNSAATGASGGARGVK